MQEVTAANGLRKSVKLNSPEESKSDVERFLDRYGISMNKGLLKEISMKSYN